jgi:lipase chaperone LimK
MKRYLPYVLVLVVILLVLFAIASRNRPVAEPTDVAQPGRSRHRIEGEQPDSQRRDLVDALRVEPESAIEMARKPLPRSLEGTEVDGGLAADADGHLIVGRGVRDLFDYFLSATGEEPLSVIRARIVAEIEKRLPPTAAREAIDLLDRYLDYRERARELYAEDGFSGDLSTRLEQIRTLRREVFGEEEAEALFGEEEVEDYVAVAQREVLRDQSLSEEERRRRLEELEQQLPEPVRKGHEETMKPMRFFREQEELRAASASNEEIRALRESYWGPEAADRLDALDREQAAWQKRVDDYRTARAAIENDPSLSPEKKVRDINELIVARFAETERIRVEALDRIEQQK